MADDPRIAALSDALEITPRRAARAVTAADVADPLRALLADEDRALETLVEAVWNGTRGPADPSWADLSEWRRDQWRNIKIRQHLAVLAALREVAGL